MPVFAEEVEESLTLDEALNGFEFTARVVRKAALEEGYSWEESRMVAIAAMEGMKQGWKGEKLMQLGRERAQNKISDSEEEAQKLQNRIQTRTRNERGNMPDDVKRYINRKEETTRSENQGDGGGTGGGGKN